MAEPSNSGGVLVFVSSLDSLAGIHFYCAEALSVWS